MRPILAVLHQQNSVSGRVGEFLQQRGYPLEHCQPCCGQSLPQSLDEYAGTVIFGGPQSANDDHDQAIRAELDWLEHVGVPAGRPLLGICLGAQLIARVLGAEVGPHHNRIVEIGYYPVYPTEHADDFLTEATMFYQWHSETFGIPHTAVHLAHNGQFPGQAFRYGARTYAIEFHPEMTLDMINRWCTSESGAKKLALSGACSHRQQLDDYARYAAASDRWLTRFLAGLFNEE